MSQRFHLCQHESRHSSCLAKRDAWHVVGVHGAVARLARVEPRARPGEHLRVRRAGDHGEQLGDHHLLGKIGYSEESYRIPMIVRIPEKYRGLAPFKPGQTVGEPGPPL